jgi:hypothetical protein
MTDKYSNYTPDDDFKKKEQQQKDELRDATEKIVEEKYSNYDVNDEHKIKELEQEKELAESTAEEYKTRAKSSKKKLSILIISMIFVGGMFGTYVFFSTDDAVVASGDEMRSQFVIQNLRGDTIDTWISWKVTEGDLFHVHVVDSPYATQERLDAILEVIMSEEEIEIDNSLMHKGPKGTTSTYYVGWNGALNSIDDSGFTIPKNLHFHVTDKGEGHILVELTNLSNVDGYAGYTKAIVDEEQHQILKSTITIYNIESLGIEQLKTIFRHELGHGFGLAHSTAPEDLMAPTITTNYPYISECDLDAIALLYDGGQSSQVVCEK